MYNNDQRIVVTLDAGGTNFVFGAMRGCEYIIDPVTYPSHGDDLDMCLKTIVDGFNEVISLLPEAPVAISFAFPGPASYRDGIIDGGVSNLPAFMNTVALGPYLNQKFNLPIFINNDGDLFAYGEALCGALPEVNARLEAAGSPKRYRNLCGFTFGTGFGVGLVIDRHLNLGDNSCIEIFCMRHKRMPEVMVEDGVSIRAVKRVYGELAGCDASHLTPRDIFEIAEGNQPGCQASARKAFDEMGETAGNAMAAVASLIDGIIVIGGGITAARKYMIDGIMRELRAEVDTLAGGRVRVVQPDVYCLEDEREFEEFCKGETKTIYIPQSDIPVVYDGKKRIGVIFSKLGASRAISVGAYAYALSQLDNA